MQAFDNRLVALSITIAGETVTYDQSYYILATGTKYVNGNFAEGTVRIDNISKKTRDLIINKTSQWNPNFQPASITLSVGRQSSGSFVLFSGDAIASNPTQPPDIALILRSLSFSGVFAIPNAFSAAPTTNIQAIAQQVADSLGLTLKFQSTSTRQIANYNFTGAAGKQIAKLAQLGIWAYQDGDSLIVTDPYGARTDVETIDIDTNNGLIGVPEVTEIGARARVLITREINIGTKVNLTSKINPAVNGAYTVIKLMFEIASRDTPFYWILEMQPNPYSLVANP